MNTKRLFQFLLLIGAAFYAFEFVIHFFGLPILEHDKIFLPTHDRYIALYGLTYAALLGLIAWKPEQYRMLFVLTMIGVLTGMLNASYIAANGWYTTDFDAPSLDRNLSAIGFATFIWYPLVWILWIHLYRNRHVQPDKS